MKNKDLIFGIMTCLFSFIYLGFTREIKVFHGVGSAPIDARWFPVFLGLLLLIMSIALIIRSIKTRKESLTGNKIIQSSKIGIKPFLSIGLLVFYICSMNILGFIISTFCYLLFQTLLFTSNRKKAFVLIALLSLLLSVIIDLLFVKLFHVMLPVGMFGF